MRNVSGIWCANAILQGWVSDTPNLDKRLQEQDSEDFESVLDKAIENADSSRKDTTKA